MSRTYRHLSPKERAVIMIERQNGSSLRKIALRLGHSTSTVSRKIRRCDRAVYNVNQAAPQLPSASCPLPPDEAIGDGQSALPICP